MTIADRTVLVTGANRGIGQALVEETLNRGARCVYAVNLFGTYAVTQAFLPLLTQSREAIVTGLSLAAFASLPIIPAAESWRRGAAKAMEGQNASLVPTDQVAS